LHENSSNNNSTTQMEWGYALLKRNLTVPIDGCNFVTIKNSTITLDKSNTVTWGIYAANHTATSPSAPTLSDTADVMSYCKFNFNTIINSYNGIRIISATSATFLGQHNEVGVNGGNNILNFGGGTVQAYGMNLEYQNNLKIANNVVNNGNPSHNAGLYGIRTGSGANANLDLYSNTITLTQVSNLSYAITNSTFTITLSRTV
jgi:hypothetical protein